jgi:hypothetical protein
VAALDHYILRKRKTLGDFVELRAKTREHLSNLMPDLEHLDRLIEGPEAVNGALVTACMSRRAPALRASCQAWMCSASVCASMSEGAPLVAVDALNELSAVLAALLQNRSRRRPLSLSSKEEALDAATSQPTNRPACARSQARREALPIAQDTTVLLQALADLLLGALGEPIKEPASATHDAGGGDESEDHV